MGQRGGKGGGGGKLQNAMQATNGKKPEIVSQTYHSWGAMWRGGTVRGEGGSTNGLKSLPRN